MAMNGPGQTSPPTSSPPFADTAEVILSTDLVHPTAYRTPGPARRLHRVDDSTVETLQQWLKADLGLTRLNQVHEHLWMAGLPQIARALHEQIRIGRSVVLTEQADLHMVWDARGLLLSYLWLLPGKSDWKAAVDRGLLSDKATWPLWVSFVRSCLAIGDGLDHDMLRAVNPRYLYGELRLERLSLIYRFCRHTRTVRTLLRGYNYAYHDYRSFVARNFAWTITATIYITIVLTAMQVGLATTRLTNDVGFQRAAYGFTVFAIIGPLAVLLAGAFILVVIFSINWRYARKQQTSALAEHPHLQTPAGALHRRRGRHRPSDAGRDGKGQNLSAA